MNGSKAKTVLSFPIDKEATARLLTAQPLDNAVEWLTAARISHTLAQHHIDTGDIGSAIAELARAENQLELGRLALLESLTAGKQ